MRAGYHEACLGHDPGPHHPESPERLRAVHDALSQAHNARIETPAPASVETVASVHEPAYLASIERVCDEGGGSLDADTVASAGTWAAAIAGAGLAVWAAAEAPPGREASDVPIALCRPPGHHATANAAMGFCFLNNAAIAAETALDEGPAETVAIFDWDVHHGNGTQSIFERRADVPYASIHQSGLYPGTGGVDEVGTGPGEGATLNVPFRAGAGSAAYLAAFDDAIAPWLRRHGPDLLIVSAGFDAHRNDTIARMALDTEAFGLLADRTLALARGLDARLAFVLEGGYRLNILADGVTMVHEVCEGYEPVEPDAAVRDADRERITAVRARHGLGS